MPSTSIYLPDRTQQAIDQILESDPRFRSRSQLIAFLVDTYLQASDFRSVTNDDLRGVLIKIEEMRQYIQSRPVVSGSEEYEDVESVRRGIDIIDRLLDD